MFRKIVIGKKISEFGIFPVLPLSPLFFAHEFFPNICGAHFNEFGISVKFRVFLIPLTNFDEKMSHSITFCKFLEQMLKKRYKRHGKIV
jgi:hypothetical protein